MWTRTLCEANSDEPNSNIQPEAYCLFSFLIIQAAEVVNFMILLFESLYTKRITIFDSLIVECETVIKLILNQIPQINVIVQSSSRL